MELFNLFIVGDKKKILRATHHTVYPGTVILPGINTYLVPGSITKEWKKKKSTLAHKKDIEVIIK